MIKYHKYLWAMLTVFALLSFTISGDTPVRKYKCMVQLTNYPGEGAYIAISVLDKDKKYIKTLYVMGNDPEWQHDLTSWWGFQENEPGEDIDAISGETRAGGERMIFAVEIEDELLDKGNIVRFESAVENQKYVEQDLEFPLTTENLNGKFEGSAYIRYVRMIPGK